MIFALSAAHDCGVFDTDRKKQGFFYITDIGRAFFHKSDQQYANGCVFCCKGSGKNGTKLVTEGSLKGLKSNAVILCTVLSNLLDNAVEAAAVTNTDRIIKLSAKRSDSFYYISISNPTVKSVDVSTDIPTSKHDSAHHGLGLKSVRSAVEKCGGTLELSCKKSRDGYEFTAEVILPVES